MVVHWKNGIWLESMWHKNAKGTQEGLFFKGIAKTPKYTTWPNVYATCINTLLCKNKIYKTQKNVQGLRSGKVKRSLMKHLFKNNRALISVNGIGKYSVLGKWCKCSHWSTGWGLSTVRHNISHNRNTTYCSDRFNPYVLRRFIKERWKKPFDICYAVCWGSLRPAVAMITFIMTEVTLSMWLISSQHRLVLPRLHFSF